MSDFTESLEYLENIYDKIPIPICLLDDERRVVYANGELCRLIGLDSAALAGGRACGIFGCSGSFDDPRGCGFGKKCPGCGLLAAVSECIASGRRSDGVEYNPVLSINGIERQYNFVCSVSRVKAGAAELIMLCLNDVTRFRQAERRAAENEERFETIFRMSPDAVLITRADTGLIVEASDGFYALGGFEPAETIGRTTRELGVFISPADRDAIIKELSEKGFCAGIEHDFAGKDGKIVTCLLSAKIIKLGGVDHIISVLRDISSRKAIENALRESESKFRAYIDASPEGIFVVDGNGRYLEANSEGCRNTGYSREEYLAMTVKDRLAMTSLDPQKDADHFAKLIATGSASGVFQFRRKDGSLYWCTLKAVKVSDDLFIGFENDITELMLTRNRLELSEKRFNSLLNTYAAGFIIADTDGRIVDANKKYCEMTGYSREELLELKIIDIEAVENIAEQKRHIEKIISTGYDLFETRHVRKNGEIFDVEMSVSFEPENSQFLAFAYDISARKAAEKAAEKAKKAAEEASEAKSVFLANMSHEMRTPLNSILGYANLLSMDSGLSDEARDFVNNLVFSAQSLLSIINDVLDLAKIEAGKLEIYETEVKIRDLLARVIDMFKPGAAARNLELSLSIDDNMPDIMTADPVRLSQVLINLLSNAVKFTETGKISLKASFEPPSKPERPGAFTFAVSDTGIGINEDERKLLFKAFSQADPSIARKFGGTGLGLVISNTLVRKMGGGDIALESEKGRGSEFSFTLFKKFRRSADGSAKTAGPVTNDSKTFDGPEMIRNAPATAGPAADSKAPSGRERKNGPAVLIADDSHMNARLFTKIIMNIAPGASVTCARNGREAFESFKNSRPDIIFMDIQMPEVDGYQAIKMIREAERAGAGDRRTVIVALTASAVKGEQEKCGEAGADGFLSKPLDFNLLKDMIEKFYDGR